MKLSLPSPEQLRQLRTHPVAGAALKTAALLLASVVVAAMLAWPFGYGVSALGVLLLFAAIVTLYLSHKTPRPSEQPDAEALALDAFAETPLGSMLAENKDQLAKARRAVGRQSPMYHPLDRLVRATRKIERRLALDDTRSPDLARLLTRELPLIATTAVQYTRIKDEPLSDAQAERLVAAEGVLRDSATRLEDIAKGDGRADTAVVGLARLDAHAEVLAQYIETDIDAASGRANALRAAHELRRLAKERPARADDLAEVAALIEGAEKSGDATFDAFLSDALPALAAALAGDADEAALGAALTQSRAILRSGA